MMFTATPRRAPQTPPETRPVGRQARTLSARGRLARRAGSRPHCVTVRPAKQRAQPWRFWWCGPTYEA